MQRIEDYISIVGPSVVDDLRLLAEKLKGRRIVHVNSTAVGGGVAEILNRLGQKASKTTIAYIEQADEKLASVIKDMMFTFEDIMKLDGNAVREILKVADKRDLMIALKGSIDDLKRKFFDNMSQRAQEAFVEEMNFLGAVRVKDVEEAQRKIVEEVQKLASMFLGCHFR